MLVRDSFVKQRRFGITFSALLTGIAFPASVYNEILKGFIKFIKIFKHRFEIFVIYDSETYLIIFPPVKTYAKTADAVGKEKLC